MTMTEILDIHGVPQVPAILTTISTLMEQQSGQEMIIAMADGSASLNQVIHHARIPPPPLETSGTISVPSMILTQLTAESMMMMTSLRAVCAAHAVDMLLTSTHIQQTL